MYLTGAELNQGLEHIQNSPNDDGILQMIVIRPATNERVALEKCPISSKFGVHGDNWAIKCWKTLPDGSPHPEVQIAITNSRCIALLARDKSRMPLAGDNLYVDLNLSDDNLRAGQKLAIGSAIIEITAHAHNGCAKFKARYGPDAVQFVNSPIGKKLHLRGIYAKVVQDGVVQVGDRIMKVD
jgi:MOSC domain-containing protein YiiM